MRNCENVQQFPVCWHSWGGLYRILLLAHCSVSLSKLSLKAKHQQSWCLECKHKFTHIFTHKQHHSLFSLGTCRSLGLLLGLQIFHFNHCFLSSYCFVTFRPPHWCTRTSWISVFELRSVSDALLFDGGSSVGEDNTISRDCLSEW